jgi:hypothetical protein
LGGAALTGYDPSAPDIGGVRRRHPCWDISRDEEGWHARELHGLAEMHARSLESLEGKLIRAETAWSTVGEAARLIAS